MAPSEALVRTPARFLLAAFALLVVALGAQSCGSQSAQDRGAPHGPALPAVSARQPCRPRHERPPRGGLLIGTHAGLRFRRGRQLCVAVALARASGARAVREDVDWSLVQPHPGPFRWRQYDEIFLRAARRGLMVLPILDGTPRWAAAPRGRLPLRRGPYATFARRAVARYGPGGAFWRAHSRLASYAPTWFELENEPYLVPRAQGGSDPGAYARLVRSAVAAARAANPHARFLLEVETTYMPAQGPPRSWLDGLYAAVPDLNRFFDGVAVHPYSAGRPPSAGLAPGDPRWQTARLGPLHAALVARGAGDKPTWVTEIGWSTCPRGPECVSESRQAANLRAMLDLVHGPWSFVSAVFVFELRDRPGAAPDDREGSFGVVHADGSAKPSWGVVGGHPRP